MLYWHKFQVKINIIFNLFFHAERNQELKPILYPINLQEFLCLKIVTWPMSIIFLRVPGRFLNTTVFQSHISDFQLQNPAQRKSDWDVLHQLDKKIRTCLGHKMIMFCITVIFINRLHRIKQIWYVENEQFLPRDSSVAQC